MKRWIATAFLLVLILTRQGLTQSTSADIVLKGDVSGAQNKTYFEIPFNVPAGTHRISADFEYTGKDERATLDLGIADPERFRGQSGGNKSHFTISETDATPSYLPGAIPPVCGASSSLCQTCGRRLYPITAPRSALTRATRMRALSHIR
jgi:hypothetical protein